MAGKGKKAKDWRRSKSYAELRQSIMDYLGGTQVIDALTLSRVEEYLDFWVLRHQLQDDVTARGLYVTDDRGRTMENRSVSLSIQASRQMAAISAALGLSIGTDRRLEEDDL